MDEREHKGETVKQRNEGLRAVIVGAYGGMLYLCALSSCGESVVPTVRNFHIGCIYSFHIKCILVVKNECVFSVVSWKYNMSNTTVCRVMIRFFLEHAEELRIFILRENEKYNLQ